MMTKENYRPIFIYEPFKKILNTILATQIHYNKFDELILKFIWKRKRAKNNGDHFEEQVWEHVPYKRLKLLKLHQLRQYDTGTGIQKQTNRTERAPTTFTPQIRWYRRVEKG